MFVLKIIGVIALLLGVYALVERVKEITFDKYGYKSFEPATAAVVAIGYYFLYFGWDFFAEALKYHGDILNGIILMIIGVVLVGIMFLAALKSMEFSFMGFVYALFEFGIYIPVAFVGLFIVLLLIAALSDTRPVWVVNND